MERIQKNILKQKCFPKVMSKKIIQAKEIREDSGYDVEFRQTDEVTKIQIETAK